MSLSLACGGLAALPFAETAAAAALTPRTVSLRTVPTSPASGSTETLTGVLSASPAQTTVKIQQYTSKRWVTRTSVKTGSTGSFSYSFGVKATGSRNYRAYVSATQTLGATHSGHHTIDVVAKPKKPFTRAPNPTVTGAQRVGETLVAIHGSWKPGPSSYRYQWHRDGIVIPGAKSKTYRTVAADLDHHVTVEIRASRSKSTTVRESRTHTPVASGTFATGIPHIDGTGAVGQTLTTSPGTWSPQPTTFSYAWERDGTTITGATGASYTPTTADVGDAIRVTVSASRGGYTTAETQSDPLTVQPLDPPPSTGPPIVGSDSPPSVTFTDHQPDWFPHNTLIRWDTPGAFEHSLDPLPVGTMTTARSGTDHRQAALGAEYHADNTYYKNADVSFTVTGKKFAIRYMTYKSSDAMVWIDNQPVAADAFAGSDPTGNGSWNWLVVDRDSSAPVNVRFAGPLTFTGVDHDSDADVTVKAGSRFTLGVISDSLYETQPDTHPMINGPATMLSTLTGFRVWNLAQGGTGYVNDGSAYQTTGGEPTSPYGSDQRIASVAAAPLDALLVNGSINDRYWPASTQLAALDAFLDRVAQIRPDLPVVLVTLEPISFNSPTLDEPLFRDQDVAVFRDMNANFAVAAARHPNVVGVIDPYTADWLTGTGSTVNLRGDGNQDQYIGADGIHPNAAGQAYYQGRIADELMPMLAPFIRATP